MRRLARSCVLAAVMLASGAALAHAPAAVPPAPPPAPMGGIGPHNPSAPIDISADGVDIFQPQRLIVYKGNVEAISDDTRLRTPELRVYYKPKAAAAPGAKPVATTGGPISESDSIDHIEAAGPVYYITPTETARGDHGTYVADTTTYTLTGNVVVVQGKSVGKGDRLVMNRTTGESNLYADHPQAPTQRVRMILYPNQQTAAGAKPAPKPS